MADPAVIADDLAELARVAHVDRYALLGGEPLLHPELVEIMRIAKQSGICDRVEIITNGIALDKMSAAFWEAVDYLTMSIYPNTPAENVELAKRKAGEHGFTLERKTVEFTYPLTKDRMGAASRYVRCWYRIYTHVIDNGYFYKCCMSPFIPELFLSMRKETDGIKVKGITEKRLMRFLNSLDAWSSCAVCAGHGAPKMDCEQVSEPAEWIKRSTC